MLLGIFCGIILGLLMVVGASVNYALMAFCEIF